MYMCLLLTCTAKQCCHDVMMCAVKKQSQGDTTTITLVKDGGLPVQEKRLEKSKMVFRL